MVSENEFLVHAFFMGIYITFVYDILRIFRRVIPHSRFWVSAEDLGFWMYCGAEVFLLMYRESDGTLRWFAVMGALVGMFLYKKTLGYLFVKYISLALQKMLAILVKFVKWITIPFRIVGKRVGHELKRGLTSLLKMLKM